jgi:predicted dithiol-disulfide oxidoreductase (DUF899 family)
MVNDDGRIKNCPVVSHEEWLSARAAFLAKEKEFTGLRDELSHLTCAIIKITTLQKTYEMEF